MKVRLKNIKVFEFSNGGKDLFAIVGNVRLDGGSIWVGDFITINPSIVDIVYDGDGYYTVDGVKITNFVNPEDFMPKNIHSKYKFITMDLDKNWRAWLEVEDVYYDEESECYESNSGSWVYLNILNIPPDPFGARFALYDRNEDGSWKRYYKEG